MENEMRDAMQRMNQKRLVGMPSGLGAPYTIFPSVWAAQDPYAAFARRTTLLLEIAAFEEWRHQPRTDNHLKHIVRSSARNISKFFV